MYDQNKYTSERRITLKLEENKKTIDYMHVKETPPRIKIIFKYLKFLNESVTTQVIYLSKRNFIVVH